MQTDLCLVPSQPVFFPFSYYSRLSAALYQTLQSARPEFADNLHEGPEFRNRIKLFGFSPLHCRQTEVVPEDKNRGKAGGLIFKGPCRFTVCSPLPEWMNRLGNGFSKTPHLRICSQILALKRGDPGPVPNLKGEMAWLPVQPGSIVTSWTEKGTRRRLYSLPGEPARNHSCEELLKQNLIHKWRRLSEIRPEIAQAWLRADPGMPKKPEELDASFVDVKILPLSQTRKWHRKSHHIKQAPVFSWIAPVQITAPLALQRLVWSCGLGEMNSMGFGVVKEVDP